VTGDPSVSADVGWRSVHDGRLRIGLTAGCAISICIAVYFGDPGSFTHADPALARLLRGMALIKGAIAIAAVAAVWWRFARPVSKPVAAGYLLGSWLLVGSTMLIWQLSWIPAAAILFHAAAVSMLIVSWRER
jgi:hypothetical protein